MIDQADFNDEGKLGSGKEVQDRLSKLVAISDGLDFRANRAGGDDLLPVNHHDLGVHQSAWIVGAHHSTRSPQLGGLSSDFEIKLVKQWRENGTYAPR